MKLWTYFNESTIQNKVSDTFTLTIINKCYADVLQQVGPSTGNKITYAGATLKLRAMPWSHADGTTSTDCPVTITAYVLSGATWYSSGSVYTNVISAFSSGDMTILSSIAAYGAGSSTYSVSIKTTYTQTVTG